MTDKEMKKLSRADLLEMLLAQRKENEALRTELDAARAALDDRRIALEKSGSIAEASLQLNGIFEAAPAWSRKRGRSVIVCLPKRSSSRRRTGMRSTARSKRLRIPSPVCVSFWKIFRRQGSHEQRSISGNAGGGAA